MTGRRAGLLTAALAVLLATLGACAPTPHAARSARSADTATATAVASAAADARTLPEVRPATPAQLMAAVRATGARVVLLNAWATWCVPCREEFPDLMRLEREERARGFKLVLVSADFDSELPGVRRFLAEHGVDFVTYLKQGPDTPFIDTLDTRWSGALPATILYDGRGRKLWFHEGKTTYDTLKTRVEAALAAPRAPGP
jgi:thiol-disulfide isomerase/thioredoxin